MRILSFGLGGDFAAFKDPSVTTNQTVYYIPSKSAIIGILGAMIGVERDYSLGDIYGKPYIELFSKTKIGLRMDSEPKKITFFTNHRSFKEAKTKPFKTELVEYPKYRIFVITTDEYLDRLKSSISKSEFTYSPFLGHAYCPAVVSDLEIKNCTNTEPEEKITNCVILDESETYKSDFPLRLSPVDEQNSRIIIERHLHHFMTNGKLERRVLKHWIPVGGSKYEIRQISKTELSSFIELDGQVTCMY